MDGIPSSVPEFEYGTFDKKQSSSMRAGEQTIYNLYYEGVANEDVEAYLEVLRASGFQVTADSVTDGVSAGGELKSADGEKVIGLSISRQASGHVDYTITVLKATD